MAMILSGIAIGTIAARKTLRFRTEPYSAADMRVNSVACRSNSER
jgi:hypothetical protein